MDLAGKLAVILLLGTACWLADAGAIALRVDVTPLGWRWVEAVRDAMAAMPAPGGDYGVP